MRWLQENWLLVLLIGFFVVLPFALPFFYDYPTKEEYKQWKNNLTDEELEDYMLQQREPNFYAP
jgi:hypothetical protein